MSEKKLHLQKNTKIYIVAPAKTATGGPELLHQLAFILRQNGLNAFMHYLPDSESNPIHDAYLPYNNPWQANVIDSPENIIVVPEQFKDINYLNKFVSIQKVIWWLSVDNFYKSMYLEVTLFSIFNKVVNKICNTLNTGPYFDLADAAMQYYKHYDLKKNKIINSASLHLAQSHYAHDHLRKKGLLNIDYLSDYLNDDYLTESDIFHGSKKNNIVLYNPKKGYKFTNKLISKRKNIKFVPIENMCKSEVMNLLKAAKVYIDFGNHPGKDRMPREAALLGCCIITGKRGSANYKDDVFIHDEYKINDSEENIDIILHKIKDCIENYESNIKNFALYREKILNEKEQFLKDCKAVF